MKNRGICCSLEPLDYIVWGEVDGVSGVSDEEVKEWVSSRISYYYCDDPNTIRYYLNICTGHSKRDTILVYNGAGVIKNYTSREAFLKDYKLIN